MVQRTLPRNVASLLPEFCQDDLAMEVRSTIFRYNENTYSAALASAPPGRAFEVDDAKEHSDGYFTFCTAFFSRALYLGVCHDLC